MASPDCRYVYYNQGSIGKSDAYIFKLDSPSPWQHHLGAGSEVPVAFSGDSQKVFTAASNAWDLSSWPPEPLTFDKPELQGSATDIAADHDGRTVARNGDNGVVWVWRNMRDSTQQIALVLPEELDTFAVHPDVDEIAVWLTGGQLVRYCFNDQNVSKIALTGGLTQETEKTEIEREAYLESRVYGYADYANPGKPRPSSLEHWVTAERKLRILHSQRKVFGQDGRISRLCKRGEREWTVETHNSRKPQERPEISKLVSSPLAVGHSCSGDVLVAFETNAGIEIFNAQHLTRTTLRQSKSVVLMWAAFDKACSFVAAQASTSYFGDTGAGIGGSVYLWDLRKPDSDPVLLPHFGPICTSIAFNRESRLVALGLADRRGVFHRRGLYEGPYAEKLVDGAIVLHDLMRPHADPIILNGPKGDVTSTAFSRHGDILAAGTSCGRIAIFRLTSQASRPLFLDAHSSPILFLGFEKQGTLLSIGADRTVRTCITETAFLADAAGLRVARNLSPSEWAHYIGEDIPY
ncbi:MAG: WD40 repeat domain-containing protein, partial [Verrucomicrobia bacterium]|nr:WD40 repeat domain-containing protein [Verrucomicrobiota bacterium]